MTFDKRSAKAAGKRSGAARKRLTLEDVETAFGMLDSLEDAQRRLERLGVWAAAGLLPGSVAGAACRSVEIWIRASESKLTREVVEELKAEVARLKAEIGQRTKGEVWA